MPPSNYLSNIAIDTYFTDATTYLSVHETGGPVGTRQLVDWEADASNRAILNETGITFSALVATSITHLGIWDASTSGNLLAYVELDTPITHTSGEDLNFGVWDIAVRFE